MRGYVLNTLLIKSINGDKDAYVQLIESIYNDLYKIAKIRLNNIDDINDAINETILKSYENLSKLKNLEYFKTWIIRILINECNNIYRENQKQNHISNILVNHAKMYSGNHIEQAEDEIEFNELISKLNYNEKMVVLLHYKCDFSVKQIAEILNINLNTVKSRLHRAKNKIKEEYNEEKSQNHSIKKIVIFIICFSILTTGIVFAKDIIQYISNIFTNSTTGIDTATKNGYVQNIDMDFIYDQNIGIKANYLSIDNNNLDISFVYYGQDTNIVDIDFVDFVIRDENNNIICYHVSEAYALNSSNIIEFTCNRAEKQFVEDTGEYIESILCSSFELPKINQLTIEIDNFIVTDNAGEKTTVKGNWLFTIDINNEIMTRNTESYAVSYNEYIENISCNISETSLKIELDINQVINEETITEINSVILKNDTNEFACNYKNFSIDDSSSHLLLQFEISSYMENIDKLSLSIHFDTDKYINVNLSK